MLSAALRLLHRALGAALGRLVLRRMRADGVPVTPEQRQQMARRLHREVVSARRRSYAQAARAIREFDPNIRIPELAPYPVAAVVAALDRAIEPPPPRRTREEPEEPQPSSRVRVSGADEQPRQRVRVTAPEIAERPRSRVAAPSELDPQSRRRARSRVIAPTLENRTDPRVVVQVSERLSATLARHAAEAGRNAVVNAALGVGDEVGWARVLSGAENCPFCAMLASRGPVYRSDKSALTVVGRGGRPRGNRALGERYHDGCDCEAVLVRRGQDWEGREEFERLERLWIAASTAGAQADEEPRRVFNRAFRRIEREPELGEEIEKLWADSTEGLSGSEAIRAFTAAIKENPPAALATARRPRRATTDE
ncbi:VG15 protein [Nocardia gipuzkoensis]